MGDQMRRRAPVAF